MSILSLNEWDEFISNCPEAHLLQTGAWGELKVGFGWEPVRLLVDNGDIRWGAQVLFRQLPLGLTLRAVFLKVEPDDYFINHDAWEKELPEGFHCSSHSIQPRRTIVVDLRGSEDDILSRMKQKTRYNIRLAARKGVSVRPSADVDVFFRLMQTTGERDQFGIHTLEYYQKAFNLFKSKGACELLLAEFEGEPLAVLMVFASGKRSWYLYGASASLHRELMPTYLLQWEAMKWARSVGCTEYDLWGVPDYDQEILEAEFNKRSDGMWGIYRFKRGFGGTVHRSIGVWDRVYKPFFYKLYLRWVNKDGNR
jgi:lipid II:glycine glycyltransferase (peptidoglycan interpeptide bridge formation enzyme)